MALIKNQNSWSSRIYRFRQGVTNMLAGVGARGTPVRDTSVYPRLMQLGTIGYGVKQNEVLLKPTPSNLRFFSRTPHARRCINAVKDPIAELEWEIIPLKGIDPNPELDRQSEIVRNCLDSPNEQDSFRTWVEQIVEDLLIFGDGRAETQISSDPARPLWMWPIDSPSIKIYPLWNGEKNTARYKQTLGFGNFGNMPGKDLLDSEVMSIRLNPSSETPYGYGPLEIAYNTVTRILAAADYAGNVAGNAQPQNIIAFKGVAEGWVQAFRNYWRNEVEGQGMTPILGDHEVEANVHRLRESGDSALYLKYQEFILRELCAAFGISPQNVGLEADVNRNTSEVNQDRDWDQTIKPMAARIESAINRHAIQKLLGFSQIRFRFIGMDREDEEATAKIYETHYKNNMVTPNEHRDELGLPPMESEWGDLTFADVQIAISASRGAKESVADVDDQQPKPTKPRAKSPKKLEK